MNEEDKKAITPSLAFPNYIAHTPVIFGDSREETASAVVRVRRSAIFSADNRSTGPVSRLIYDRTLLFSSCTRLLVKSIPTSGRGREEGKGGKQIKSERSVVERDARGVRP